MDSVLTITTSTLRHQISVPNLMQATATATVRGIPIMRGMGFPIDVMGNVCPALIPLPDLI